MEDKILKAIEQYANKLIQGVMQEGGNVPEEQIAQEQQVAETQQPTQEQVMQFIAQALQGGTPPEEILAQLVQNGIPQEVATQLIQGVIGQSQQAPQEEQGEIMQEPTEQEQGMAQEGVGFNFSTRYTPTLAGYNVSGSSVVDKDSLTNVEPIQSFTGQGYGQQMASVEDLMKLHSWYFDTPEKKEKFREAAKKEGQQEEVIKFQNAYNTELRNRAEKAGVPKTEVNKIIEEVGFSGRGVKKFDGLAGAFTTTRPLYDFKKVDGEVKATVTPVETPQVEQRNITKNVFPMLPQDLRLFPSSLDPLYKEQIALGRAEPTKLTTEPFLASQESQRQADIARVQASGLSPAQQEALLSQQLASSQIASNDAIAKVEMANQANQAQVDQFNLGQRSKEELTNLQFGQQYENQVLGGLNAYESALRSYYTEGNLQNRADYKTIENLRLINAENENYQYVPGNEIIYNNTPTTDLSLRYLSADQLAKLTPQQQDEYKKRKIEESRVKNLSKYKTTIQNP